MTPVLVLIDTPPGGPSRCSERVEIGIGRIGVEADRVALGVGLVGDVGAEDRRLVHVGDRPGERVGIGVRAVADGHGHVVGPGRACSRACRVMTPFAVLIETPPGRPVAL